MKFSPTLAFCLLLAVLLGLPAVHAQQQERPVHHWIVLLDVSASFEDRERAQSRPLGERYRLRNETLSLLQSLLAAKRIKELDNRDDQLSVYVFGEGAERVKALSTMPVVWSDVRDQEWWSENLAAAIPSGMPNRTDYFEALRKARGVFLAEDRKDIQKHVILISDGELDVGEENRPPGAPPGVEEMRVYRNVLRQDTDPLNWFLENDVQITTLAVDEGLAGFNNNKRQQDIQKKLYEFQGGSATPLDRARALVNDFSGRIRPDGNMQESEGPYVLHALARAFRGEARSVRFNNVFDTLWETIFPERTYRRVLPPGTKRVIVFAPEDSPVKVTVDPPEGVRKLSVIYEPQRESYRVEPPEYGQYLTEVQFKRTEQYITWLLGSPWLKEVDQDLAGGERDLSLVAVTNVGFAWQEGKPPEDALGDQPIPLALDLLWLPSPNSASADAASGPLSKDEWRQILTERRNDFSAVATVQKPDSETSELTLTPTVVTDDSDAVLRLEGQFRDTQAEGNYEVEVSLRLGPGDEDPEIRAPVARFNLLQESPLSREGRFTLFLRRWKDGEPGKKVEIRRPKEGATPAPVVLWIESSDSELVVFEWHGSRDEQCKGVERLRLSVPDLDLNHDWQSNALTSEEPVLEDDRRVCYRTPGIRIEGNRWGTAYAVKVTDIYVSWERLWQVDRPTPTWMKVLWGILLFLLLVLAALAYFFRKRILAWWRRLWADVPLVVAVETSRGVEEVGWSKGDPKRFAVSQSPDGKMEVALSKKPVPHELLAIELEGRRTYRIRATGNLPWEMRWVDKEGRVQGPRPVTRSGEVVRLLEFLRGQSLSLVLGNGKAQVYVRHRGDHRMPSTGASS